MPLELDDLGRAVGGLEQVQRHFATDVAAAAGRGGRRGAAAEEVAEEPFAEDVAEGVEDVADVVELRGPAALQAGMAVAVVARPASPGG